MALFIIDSHALMYRAFYAMEKMHLSTDDGIPTGALYGMAQYIMNTLNTYSPEYIVAVMDPGTKCFRHDIYPEYKKNRSAMPMELICQLTYLVSIYKAFGIKVEKHPGFEADDIIANITRAYSEKEPVRIISKDKDLMQLVDDMVYLLAPNGSGIFETIDSAYVEKKFGVKPTQLCSYLALVGDSSDNIPGVAGIGPKKAAALIRSGKPIDNADYYFSYNLVKFEECKELVSPLEEYKYNGINKNDLENLFRTLQFTSLLKDIV